MNNHLERFIEKQKKEYPIALQEIKNGQKRSHWMWYIFPQLDGLGQSYYSHYYGIRNIEEAKAYLDNTYLRTNLLTICNALLQLERDNITAIMGDIDAIKLKASMTLFAHATTKNDVFLAVLKKYYRGSEHQQTLQMLYRR